MELFEELKDDIWNAQLVGKNLFCKNPSDTNVFCQYFDYCIKVARYPIEIESKTFFANEAELALTVFCEKVEINRDILTKIQGKRSELASVSNEINKCILQQNQHDAEEKERLNDEVLSSLSKLKGKMSNITTQQDFDKIISDMSIFENKLDKTMFTEGQTNLYNTLTKDFSTLVSQKMAFISHSSDIEYNKKAVTKFKRAFELFKKDENKYKSHDSDLYELVAKYLFAFDARRLFNESLVYYNHVYSYIFNKLDDTGKYRFTQFSFDVPKSIN